MNATRSHRSVDPRTCSVPTAWSYRPYVNASPRDARTGLLLGVLASSFGLLVSFVLGWQGVSFAPASAGQAFIELLPGFLAIPLIELLREWAKRLLEIGVVIAFLLAGAFAGRVAVVPRHGAGLVTALTAGPWALTVALGAVFAAGKIDLAGTLLNASLGAVAQAGALAWLLGSTPELAPSAAGRRRVLVRVGAVAATIAGASVLFGSGLRNLGTRLGNVAFVARALKLRVEPTPEEPAFARIAGLTPRLTPTADHYTVDSALLKPSVDIAQWTLEVRGAVDRPFTLTYEELLDLAAVEQLHTLACISNEIGGPLSGTSLWTGVPLVDLLTRAGPRAGAFDVVLRSVDGYADSIPLAKALEPETVVAYLMNGRTIPQDHGYPVRVLVPNIYGMKNVKWLRSIEVVTFDFRGYWMERGWSDLALVNTAVRIDVPRRTLKWDGREVTVAGIALAGSRGIRQVEVSFDDGTTWQVATLERALGPLTWQRWAISWTPPAVGTHSIAARATDGTGQLQTAVRRGTFPDGATGYDRLAVSVQRG